MKKNFLLTFIALLISTSLLAKGVKIYVNLSPAGSFEAVSRSVKGTLKVDGDSVSAQSLSVSVKRLKTGLDLRDEHFWKELKSKKYPKVRAEKIVGKNGKGTAILTIRGIKKKVSFTYKKLDAKYMKATFTVNLKEFKFTGIKYMGVGVKDIVRIEVEVRYK